MKKYQLGQINILIADHNIQLRNGLKGVLHQSGFRNIRDASTLEQMVDEIKINCPDILLCDISLPEGDVCKTIKQLRHNQCGDNPFCSVILFIDEPNESTVRAASEAGLDDLQIKPVIGQKVLDRVNYLIEKRKPFVVTTDYIGPDRRKSHRPGTQQISAIDVPNSVKLKAHNEFNQNAFRDQVSQTVWDLNAQKIERHAFQISYLVERIVPAYRNNAINRESLGQVAKLVEVSRDISKRLEESEFAHISSLVDTLKTVAHSLWKSGTSPKRKDLELLPELSAAISATFRQKIGAVSAADEITSSVRKKYSEES